MSKQFLLPNTFGISTYVSELRVLSDEETIVDFFEDKVAEDVLILGDGSNILPSDTIKKSVVIVGIDEVRIAETGDVVDITVGAGKNWDKFVRLCAKSGYHGLENLSLIPGKLGAAPVQNIGAYGVEQDEFFVKLRGFDINANEFRELKKEDCSFGYRDSIFKNELKGKFLITEITYRLSKKFFPVLDYGGVREYMYENYPDGFTPIEFVDAIASIRRSKLPYPEDIGNAGSFFKNPIISPEKLEKLKTDFPDLRFFEFGSDYKLSAAWLIDQCGWKGHRDGDAGIYEKHALIMVNHGQATGRDIFELSEKIINSVDDKFGVKLEREVNLLGF